MRILNLHFKNINSLEGETFIDFTQAPFSDTGVFAITGPNGSGKSSILDAITLGLYGETFRFNKPAAHVMTKQTAECFSKVSFSVGAEQYQASWFVEREAKKATGEVQAAVMKLTHLNSGEVLASTAQQVCTRITEITGMNFRNFTRSILLAQGDFAAFLNALDTERMDILEKIIGADIYTKHKQEIIDKAEQAKQEIERLKQSISGIQLLPAEKQEAYEHDLVDYREQHEVLSQQQASLRQQQDAARTIVTIQNRISMQKKELKQAKDQEQHLENQLNSIDANQHALAFKEDLEQINGQRQGIDQGKKDLVSLQNEVAQLRNKLVRDNITISDVSQKSVTEQQQIISQLKTQSGQLTANLQSEALLARSLTTQLGEKQNELNNLKTWLTDHVIDESLLTDFPELGKLLQLQADLKEINTQYTRMVKQAKDSLAASDANKASLEKEKNNLRDAIAELEFDEREFTELMAKHHSLEELESAKKDQYQRVQDFQEMRALAEVYQRLLPKRAGFFSFLSANKEQEEVDIDALRIEHEELKKEVLREENIKIVLEQAIFQEDLLKKMNPTRQYLIDGKPCPLCGSLDHPYSKKPPRIASSQQALFDQQAKIKDLLAKTYRVGQHLQSAKRNAEHQLSNQTRRKRISSQWLSLCNRLNAVTPGLEIGNLTLMEELLATEIKQQEELNALFIYCRKKQQNIVKLKASIENGQAMIERLKTTIESFTADIEEQSRQQIELDNKLKECQQAERELADKVFQQLTALGEVMPSAKTKVRKKDKNPMDALIERLTARQQDYQSHLSSFNRATEEITLLRNKLTASENEIRAAKIQLEHITNQLQSEEGVSLHLTVVEKQKMIADKEQQLAQQTNQLSQMQQALQQKIQGTEFANLTALAEILALIASKPSLQQQLQQTQRSIVTKMQDMEKTNVELEDYFKLAESALPEEELNAQLKLIHQRLEDSNMEIRRLDKELNEHKTAQKNHQNLINQLAQQEQHAQPYFAELDTLNTENGMVFRRKVQQQLANKLLVQTNSILEKISGRYYLRQNPSDQGLALIIEDTLQANAKRLPKTLSGGESFVISLALALGLSELANEGHSVDSLFIDEGFGNLDAETLYVIISTLENLHTHGKMVGVISHVEAVKQRFKAQLQVVKKPNGMGMLQTAVS